MQGLQEGVLQQTVAFTSVLHRLLQSSEAGSMSAVAMLNGGLGGDGDYRDRTARQKQYAQELEQQASRACDSAASMPQT